MSIQIFACDHRKNIDWKLPYIRLGGGPESDSAINIKDDEEISPYSVLLSEGANIWWVWKHLKEFGDPEYVGFCHYRRFFTFVSNLPITDISERDFDEKYCAKPFELEYVMKESKVDGVIFHPLLAVSRKECDYKNIVDQLKCLSKKDGLGITDEICDKAFEFFVERTPPELCDFVKNVMEEDLMYACNIFVLKSGMLDEYCRIFVPAVKDLYEYVPKEQFELIHPRFIGYILERFTSCYLHAVQKAGKKSEFFRL